MTCYYCSENHEDDPCPKRKEDAERFRLSGLEMYPDFVITNSIKEIEDTEL